MTDALYLNDAYLTRFDAEVVGASPEGILLDRTAFYPSGGGQPADRGEFSWGDGGRARVRDVQKTPAGIVHVLDPPSPDLAVGTRVSGTVDWTLRFAHMRYHTALHILSGVVFRTVGSGITGNQISAERARMDFSLPGFDRSLADSLIEGVNAVVREERPVTVRFLPRSEALQDPTLVRVAQELLPDVATVRLIDIEGFDVQADGGTHVANTREVGAVRLERIENKGSRNKRLYLTVAPSEGALPH